MVNKERMKCQDRKEDIENKGVWKKWKGKNKIMYRLKDENEKVIIWKTEKKLKFHIRKKKKTENENYRKIKIKER